MTFTTPRYAIAYPEATDLVADLDDTIGEAMKRLDLALGETGTATITPSAIDTTTSVRINYSRNYTDLGTVPKPFVTKAAPAIPSTVTVHLWTSAADYTGFTLNIRASTVTARNADWQVRAA